MVITDICSRQGIIKLISHHRFYTIVLLISVLNKQTQERNTESFTLNA